VAEVVLPAFVCTRTMETAARGPSLLAELEALQDEALAELERLDQRIEQVIAECAAWREEVEGPVKQSAA
jgi:hypothetical protein